MQLDSASALWMSLTIFIKKIQLCNFLARRVEIRALVVVGNET